MKITKSVDVRPTCAGTWAYGPSQGQQCNETNPRHLIKCSTALDDGCENYYCITFHWHDHWNDHNPTENT